MEIFLIHGGFHRVVVRELAKRTVLLHHEQPNIHKHPVILDLIEQAGHRVIFCVPYWSCDSPIEYVFYTIHIHLQMTEAPMNDIEDLKTELDDIIFRLVDASFNRYFGHVGFP